MGIDKKELELFSNRYKKRISKEFGVSEEYITSSQYEVFRKSFLPKRFTWYEKWCNFAEKTLKITPDKKQIPKIEEALKTSHINTTPTGVYSFSIFFPLVIVMFFILFTYIIPLIITGEPQSFFLLFAIIVGLVLIVPLSKLPFFFANSWRMKASNQMVLCIFYIVTYMRHTSNLERAINFASDHIGAPLSVDLKKITWDVETQKYGSIKESLDNYLETWKEFNMEFVESIHLIESSLYESSESRRLNALDKGLSVMLDETFEKMLHYAHDLKSPITTLHMLGVILPILGLVILPLATNFVSGIRWFHIFTLYNLVLPSIVFYMGKTILSKRPTGYGETDLEDYKSLKKFKNIVIPLGKSEILVPPAFLAITIFVAFFIIGTTPLIIHGLDPEFDCWMTDERFPGNIYCGNPEESREGIIHSFLEYVPMKDEDGNVLPDMIGPFGIGATILSMFLVLAAGLSIGIYYKVRSSELMKIRNKSKHLEKEFAGALFQLGNRLGDGIPPEIAFSKVSSVMEGTVSGNFFALVSNNIRSSGMGLEEAIFHPQLGALKQFPSALIESSMKVLIESAKKGPLVASQALINVSEYVKEMHRVEERLRDLMADVISSMKSQIAFLTPVIAGIVIGITSMITKILITISDKLTQLGRENPDSQYSQILTLLGGESVPTFYFSAIVGIYVVQISGVLSILVNGIQNGADKLNERYLIGTNLIRSTLLYIAIATGVILIFNIIAGNVISGVL